MLPVQVYESNGHFSKLWQTFDVQKPDSSIRITLSTDTLNFSPNSQNVWSVNIADTAEFHCSISVSDADGGPAPLYCFPIDKAQISAENNDTVEDSDYLHWSGAITDKSGRLFRNAEFNMMITKDSSILLFRLLQTDKNGRFQFGNLIFFNDANLKFQLNGKKNYTEDLKIQLDTFKKPQFVRSKYWLRLDTPKFFKYDSIPIQGKLSKAGNMLKEVEIKERRDFRRALDDRYTSGEFSEPALYAYDVMKEKGFSNLGEFLRFKLSLQGGYSLADVPRLNQNHPLIFYVDEQVETWGEIAYLPISSIAYVKAFESRFIGDDPFTQFVAGSNGFTLEGSGLKVPFQPVPMIVSIYLRKGKDLYNQNPNLTSIPIKGFSMIRRFQQSQNSPVLLWLPLEDGNHFRIHFFNNSSCQRYRLTINGFSDSGNMINYTTVISTKL